VDWGSHPRWLVNRWVNRWGAEEARKLVEANNTRPDLYLRPVGLSADEAVERLNAVGVEAAPVPFFPHSVRVTPAGGPMEALNAVPSVVEDPAAAMVVQYAAFPAGSQVIDLSAAPGGKTVGLADSGATVAAADLSLGRMRRIRANVERAGVSDRVSLAVADGRFPPICFHSRNFSASCWIRQPIWCGAAGFSSTPPALSSRRKMSSRSSASCRRIRSSRWNQPTLESMQRC
jgi:16S rRNA (cytosine967-C5)-methyltransferase